MNKPHGFVFPYIKLRFIEIFLFAGIRETIGTNSVQLAWDEILESGGPSVGDVTAASIKQAMIRAYPESAGLIRASRVAVGSAFAEDRDRLDPSIDEGTKIALIPPVSGG